MSYSIAGDIGGTKTLLRISSADGVTLLQQSYPSASYCGLAEVLDEFLCEAGISNISTACFALAGPVSSRHVVLTNLPWVVDADEIASRFEISHVSLINDFAAVGMGIAALRAADLHTLQTGVAQVQGVRLVVGAGTGLGVAWLTPAHGTYSVHSSEGGHMDFAPVNDTQYALLCYLQQRYGHVSYERIVSGPGLVSIFEFLHETGRAQPSAELLAAVAHGDAAAALAQFALQGNDAIARTTLDLFLEIYGAFVGNLALASLPRGGVYVAGGIAAKIAALMQKGEFMRAFLDKGRFSELLERMPLHIVLNAQVGVLGAEVYARKSI